jgi:hypothetical protein
MAIRQTIALETLQYEHSDGCSARATAATDSPLVVNLKAAKAIGLAISEAFLAILRDWGRPNELGADRRALNELHASRTCLARYCGAKGGGGLTAVRPRSLCRIQVVVTKLPACVCGPLSTLLAHARSPFGRAHDTQS